jgi:HEPN domain-containing protein
MPLPRNIANWIESSDYDIKTADHMYATKRYVYVLFMCHLATEKVIKDLYGNVNRKLTTCDNRILTTLSNI